MKGLSTLQLTQIDSSLLSRSATQCTHCCTSNESNDQMNFDFALNALNISAYLCISLVWKCLEPKVVEDAMAAMDEAQEDSPQIGIVSTCTRKLTRTL